MCVGLDIYRYMQVHINAGIYVLYEQLEHAIYM